MIVGRDAGPDEMMSITTNKGNALKTNKTEKPTDLATKIMDKVIYGEEQ